MKNFLFFVLIIAGFLFQGCVTIEADNMTHNAFSIALSKDDLSSILKQVKEQRGDK